MAFPELVTTERLVLHRWRAPEHTAALSAVNADPEAVRFLNAGVPYSAADSERQSERFAAHWETYGFGLWAVEAAGAIVGFTGVCHPRWFPAYVREIEVGWRLHPAAWGNGYATEAGRVALEAAFTYLAPGRVIALIDVGNSASRAVAQRLAMTLGELVEHPLQAGPLEVWELRAGARPAP